MIMIYDDDDHVYDNDDDDFDYNVDFQLVMISFQTGKRSSARTAPKRS